MKKILISSFDLEVGGVERSLLSLLNNFDYMKFNIDLMLYSHSGELFDFLPQGPNLLDEINKYKTFRMSVMDVILTGEISLGMVRILSKLRARLKSSPEVGYSQMQYTWRYSLPFLPRIKEKYDVAISYLWPHYFVADKVHANIKIAWIHTDYSTIDTDLKLDLSMWNKYDYIVAVSEECKNSFLKKYHQLKSKVVVIENINSPDLVRSMSLETVENPMKLDKRFKIVSVARLSHAKGIDLAVKAMRILQDKGYNDIVWYVVGYGGDESKIRNLITELGLEDCFVLLGKRINPYPYIKEADLYVQPSRYEGKAVTVTEAQILGKPVVITNYPTAKSQVRDLFDGYITGLSVEGIASGIENLINNSSLRYKIAQNAYVLNHNNNDELKKLYQIIDEAI